MYFQQCVMLNTPTDNCDGDELDWNDGASSGSSFGFSVVPLSQLDGWRYLYSNGRDVTDGTITIQGVNVNSINQRLDMELNACDIRITERSQCATHRKLQWRCYHYQNWYKG